MLKVAVLGGGSTYTPELIQGFFQHQGDFPLDELWLMDVDQERLTIVGNFIKKIASAHGAHFDIILSNEQKPTIENANYVITQLRVGQMETRQADEYLGKRHGLIGQETTGVGGMANALRAIPVVLDIARDIQDYAPEALLVNFTNPAGLVTEAVTRYAPEIQTVGVCNVAVTIKMEIIDYLKKHLNCSIDPEHVQIDCLGLNHLTWFYGLKIDGKDYWPEVMRAIIHKFSAEEDPLFDIQTLNNLKMFPNYYLQYYYYTDKMLALQEQWPPSRAEEVTKIETDLLRQFQEKSRTELPKDMTKRGGSYYSTVATKLLNAHFNDLHQIQVLNVPHNGAVPGWNKDWVLEMPCEVSALGVQPLPTSPLPPVCEGLLAQVKAYEILTVEAAVKGDYQAAYQALLAHPLGPPADRIQTVLDDMLKTNRNYLPKFFD
ncbi:MAG: 6-phospho-beta-glucosidase [Chloroflexi bacterium]|nr:6-phospho-beta-glucosidase [Chloroflexota bacterium]